MASHDVSSAAKIEGTIHATGWSCASAEATDLVPIEFTLEESTLAHDEVDVEIINSGVCHADFNMMKNDWGATTYPFIPGHEGIGHVCRIGSTVDRVAVGDLVGIGWIKSSCGLCNRCTVGEENMCHEMDGVITNGNKGCFASHTRVKQRFAYRLPEGINIHTAGPLMCAGITVFAPLKRWITCPGMDVGVVGIGGLGHLAIQFATKMGSQVTAVSRTSKRTDIIKSLGAQYHVVTSEEGSLEARAGTLDLLIMCVPSELDWEKYSSLMKKGGVMVMCSIPEATSKFQMSYNNIVFNQFMIAGTASAGTRDASDALRFAAAHNVLPVVEIHEMDDVNKVLARLVDGKIPKDVFRFVLKN